MRAYKGFEPDLTCRGFQYGLRDGKVVEVDADGEAI